MLAETMRARTLKEALRRSEREHQDLQQYAVQRRDLLAGIQRQAERWYRPTQQDSANELLKTTRRLGESLQKLEAQYRVAGSQIRNLSDSDHAQLRLVDDNELVAFYLVGERRSWLWAISRQNVEVHVLPGQAELSRLVNDYKQTIANAPSTRHNQDAWAQSDAIDALSKIIIKPLEGTIEKSDIIRLTIVPDGILHDVPFAPLKLQRDAKPLIFSMSVNIDIALDVERKDHQAALTATHPRRALVVGDPIFNPTLDVVNIPYSLRETQAIHDIFDDQATLLLGRAATKSAYLQMPREEFDILHFATHGLIHPDEPLLSGLVFSDDQQQSLWLVPEISELSLDGKLVVLSACESSVGKRMSDEGALSLTRAFTEAGASHIIGSLWPVQDAASAELMRHFYDALINRNLAPDDALRHAQMAMISGERRWSDPYYWAGFQLHHVF